jgi:hypothetical protein
MQKDHGADNFCSSATEFLFGESVDSQITLAPGHKSTNNKSQDFALAFDQGQKVLAVSFFVSPLI